jgi:hypothetical protein
MHVFVVNHRPYIIETYVKLLKLRSAIFYKKKGNTQQQLVKPKSSYFKNILKHLSSIITENNETYMGTMGNIGHSFFKQMETCQEHNGTYTLDTPTKHD